jgi:hypothetical protein
VAKTKHEQLYEAQVALRRAVVRLLKLGQSVASIKAEIDGFQLDTRAQEEG